MYDFFKEILILLSPKFLSFKTPLISKKSKKDIYRTIFLSSIGVVFWSGIFVITLRVLKYFKKVEGLGDILILKILSMLILISFSFLIFSSILTSLSKLYLSRDLPLIHSTPLSDYKIFIARWIESLLDSSWMVILYVLPVLIACGIVYNAGFFFYVNIICNLIFISMISAGISSLLVMALVFIVPANRMKNIVVALGFILFLTLFLALRLLKPEQLVDPDAFATAVVYLNTLKAPSSPFLPSTWIYDSIYEALFGAVKKSMFHNGLSISFCTIIFIINVIIADLIYFEGFSKTQTVSFKKFQYKYKHFPLSNIFSGPTRAFIGKEIKTFFRDQTQWSQILLIGALILIYVYNFNVLPLEKAPIKTIYLQNLLSFLNMGLCMFVLTAITGRFAYPAISSEKEAFWIVKASPVTIKTIMWIKFFIYFFPLLILSEILIVATNIILKADIFIMLLSVITVFLMVPGIVAIGIGFGAAYPDFKCENPEQSVTSFGGLLFMMICAGFIAAVIILEAGPVYHIFMASMHNRSLRFYEGLWAAVSFSAVIVISICAIFLPMKFGEKSLSRIVP